MKYQRIIFIRQTPLYPWKEEMNRYVFKNPADNYYYGVINCMDSKLIVRTEDIDEANYYLEKEVEEIGEYLTSKKIFAEPIKIKFVGNYKPSRDKKVS